MTDPGNAYAPNHGTLDDATLLLPPPAPFTPRVLFLCTYVAKLANLKMNFIDMTTVLCRDPHGVLVAFNSNFGHACQPGYERYIKAPKPPAARPTPARGRARKVQGDGTCFNSATEPVLEVEHPGTRAGKVYKVKCFPSTGETQVPGVLCPDLSDGRVVLAAFVAYLNEYKLGAEPETPITITCEAPNMLDYKFKLIRSTPRMLIDLAALTRYLGGLELAARGARGAPLAAEAAARLFDGWPAVVHPPYPVRETKPSTDDVKVSFRLQGETRTPRINVFQSGKVNILGADSLVMAERIYDFFVDLFSANWARLVCLRPRCDLERLRAPRRPPPPPPPPMSDAELAELLGWDDAGPGAGAAAGGAPEPAALAAALLAAWGGETDDETDDEAPLFIESHCR